MMIALIRILFVLALLILILVLQVFLSRTEAGWPGLILPGISLLLSLIPLLNLAAPAPPATLLLTFLLSNLPTQILLAIYGLCRDNHRKKKRAELDKMNIQDLD